MDKIISEFYDGTVDQPEEPEQLSQPAAAPLESSPSLPIEPAEPSGEPPVVPADSAVEPEAKKAKPAGLLSEVYDWLQVVVVAIVGIVLIFVFAARTIEVVGPSMQPTLQNHNRIVLSDLFYTPKYGDIVVLRKASFENTPIIKRVIATEGQTVDIDFTTGIVTVDGRALDEPYTAEPAARPENFTGPIAVPPGCVFVMGDNRNDSTDSRDSRIGMVDTREIMGRLLFRIFPIGEFGGVAMPPSA